MRHDWDMYALDLDEWMPRTLEDAIERDCTIHAIAERLGVNRDCAGQAIWHHRRVLGASDWAILQLADKMRHHVYWLSGETEEINEYDIGRLDGDLYSRLMTLRSMAERSVFSSDGRSKNGRRARLILKYTGRLIEDVEEAVAEVDGA